MADKIFVGVGLSTERDPIKAIKEAMQQARTTIYKERIDLALVFSSIDFSYPGVIKAISSLLGNVPILGCSAAAIISNKGIFRKGLTIMLLSFPKTVSFSTALVKDINKKGALNAGEELSDKLLRGFSGTHRDLGLIFSDGLIEESSNLIYGLQERLGISFPLIGALASDNLRFLRTFVYFNQEVADNASCGIVLGGKLNFGWGIKHGWKPLGKPRRVTKAKANIVYEIDTLPAVKIYEEYLARDANELIKELKRISIFYPIGIRLQGEEEYLLRNIHSIGDDGSLNFQGNVPEESLIRLMIGSKESCLAATRQAVNESKLALSGKKIAFAFVFNSISRYILLGRGAKKELDIIQEMLGEDTPVIGIYTYGEQAPLRAINYHGRTYLHNQTFTILAIEE
jgi:hypothetical protein